MAEITKELGRIPVSRGDYQATIEYYKDNIVQYKRGSYQVVSESPIIGVSPTNDKNIVNPGWTLFAGTLDAQDVVNQIKEQETKSIQAVADREAEILAKSDAAEVSFNNTGTSLSGTNVQDALEETDGKISELESEVIYDVTANNNGTTFPSLSALLSSENLSTLIPTSVRHGGMTIRYVQTSNNKYVQYRLMSNTFNTTLSNWERYNDVTTSNQQNSDLDITDEQYNVLVRFENGHLRVKNFDSVDVLDSIQAILSNIGFDSIPEFDENKDYNTGEIVRYLKYVYVFTSAHVAGEWNESEVKKTVITTEHPIEVSDGVSKADLDITDEKGNVLLILSKGHIKTKNFDSSKSIIAIEDNEDSIIKVIFERGSIGDNGNFDKSNTYVFDGFFRTGKYISVGASPKIKTDTPCIIFGYDSSFRLVIKLDISKNVDFVNLSLSSSVAYIKIKVKSSTYPNVYLRGAKKYVFNIAENSGCQTALFEVQENVSCNITNENSREQLISNDILYGGCIFSLPYNYSPNGTPSRLIIFCHETPDRVWGMQNYNNPANTIYNGTSYNLQEYTYDKIIDWLNKEGFAVFDVYGSSSKYSFDRGSMANADNVNCMISGYNWFVNNYNIARDGVCVTGKSIGGLMAMRITMGIGIPVICSGLMVPSLCAIKRLFSYEDSTVKAYCEDMNFDDIKSNGTTLTWNTLKRGTNEQRKTYLLSNFDKWCLYDPWTCGINRQNKETIVNDIVDAASSPVKWGNDVFKERYENKVPLKIWSAIDDETQVSHYEHISMVNSIRNMGGYAEIRTMPNGSGGHYSTDRSPLATRMNIVTKLGYECTDIPLAWVELINFFRSFIGINI